MICWADYSRCGANQGQRESGGARCELKYYFFGHHHNFHYFILFYFILFYFILFYFILFYFILFYSILFYLFSALLLLFVSPLIFVTCVFHSLCCFVHGGDCLQNVS